MFIRAETFQTGKFTSKKIDPILTCFVLKKYLNPLSDNNHLFYIEYDLKAQENNWRLSV
jgi:hypothetical protein